MSVAVGVTSTPLDTLQTATQYTPTFKELYENYEKNFYSNLIKFIIITAIQVGIVVWVISGGGIAEIINNWPKYRCNPLIMPFAGLYGQDASENFNFCMKNVFNMNAGAVLGPVYGVMSNFTDIIGTISNVANSFRYLIANLLKGMERLMASFRDRFQFILFSIRMSFFKIMNLMGRLYTTFYAVVFMGMSAIQAAKNVANNDMVKFLLEFCFDPATPIELESGAVLPISAIAIGDRLASVNGVNPIVTSKFRFNGSKTPMVNLGGVILSQKHYVYYNKLGVWIEAGKHPEAETHLSLPELICLNTSTHTLKINGHVFSDYDESESTSVISKTQILAERSVNGGIHGTFVNDYALGLDGRLNIKLNNGQTKHLSKITINEKVAHGGTVLGIVQESVTYTCVLPDGNNVSAAQMLWNTNKWVRAGQIYKILILEKPIILYQLITEFNIISSDGYMFRDYREVSIPDMENAYEEDFSARLTYDVDSL